MRDHPNYPLMLLEIFSIMQKVNVTVALEKALQVGTIRLPVNADVAQVKSLRLIQGDESWFIRR